MLNNTSSLNISNQTLCALCSSTVVPLQKTPTDPLFWVIVSLLCISFPVFFLMCLQTRSQRPTPAEDPAPFVEAEPHTVFIPPPPFMKRVSAKKYARITDEANYDSAASPSPVEANNDGIPPHEMTLPKQPDCPTENFESDDDPCLVCWDSPPQTIIMECGHGGLCVECAGRVWKQPSNLRICPLCRQGLSGILRILDKVAGLIKVEPLHYPPAPSTAPVAPVAPLNVRSTSAQTNVVTIAQLVRAAAQAARTRANSAPGPLGDPRAHPPWSPEVAVGVASEVQQELDAQPADVVVVVERDLVFAGRDLAAMEAAGEEEAR